MFEMLALRRIATVIRGTYLYGKIFGKPMSREILQRYWVEPWDGQNSPLSYQSDPTGRSKFLVSLVDRYLDRDNNILEIGCNVGRNLDALFQAGYLGIAAIEISPQAINALRGSYPNSAALAHIHEGSAESILPNLATNQFPLVFSMAVLEHLHHDSEWVFEHIARVSSRYVITIENEIVHHWRSIPRNYRQTFEGLGMRQVEEIRCSQVIKIHESYIARVFTHEA